MQVLANQSGYQPSTTYTILSAGSGVQGTFSQVNANYAFLAPTLSYDPDHVPAAGLERYRVSRCRDDAEPALGRGRARRLGAGNPLYDAVVTTDATTARRAYGMLDGELQASLKSMLLLDSRYVRDAVTDRVRQASRPDQAARGAVVGGAALCGDNTAGAVDPTLPPERRIGSRDGCYGGTPYQPVVWGQAFGGRSRLTGDGNASTVNRSMTGFIAGADMALNDKWRAAAAGVTHSSLDNDQSSSASVNSYYLSLYGGAQYGALGVRGGASYTWYRINSDRSPGFAGFSDHDSAGYDANSAQVFGEVGYALPVGVAIEPFAGLAYVNLHTDGYTETGGAAAARRRRDDARRLLDPRRARGVAARLDRERHVHRTRDGRLAACVRQRDAVVGVHVRERRHVVPGIGRADCSRQRRARGRHRREHHEAPDARPHVQRPVRQRRARQRDTRQHPVEVLSGY